MLLTACPTPHDEHVCRHVLTLELGDSVYYPTRTEHISDNCLFGMLHSGTIKYLENPKWNCIILQILEDTVPPALQMMK